MDTTTSPLDALRPFLGDASSGQVVVVLASPGIGKTALLVHAALDAMCSGRAVLHVDVAHTVAHVCSRYDTVAEALRIPDAERRAAERHRLVHTVLGQPFAVEPLEAHLALLGEHAGFAPALIVVDGLGPDTVVDVIDDLVALAGQLGVPLWITLTVDDVIPEEVRAAGTVGIRLRGEGARIGVSVLRERTETLVPIELSPGSLVIAADAVAEPVTAPQVTLYTGGAQGSEAAFGVLAEQYGMTEVGFSFPGHRQARTVGRRELTPRQLEAGNVSMTYVSRRLNRTYNTKGTLLRGILQTLWHMVSAAHQVFVVGTIQHDGTVVGGTGWSVELARMWNKDLWVYCQQRKGWYHWEVDAWVAGEPRITADRICGTGTRKLEAHGEQALQALFARSFEA